MLVIKRMHRSSTGWKKDTDGTVLIQKMSSDLETLSEWTPFQQFFLKSPNATVAYRESDVPPPPAPLLADLTLLHLLRWKQKKQPICTSSAKFPLKNSKDDNKRDAGSSVFIQTESEEEF